MLLEGHRELRVAYSADQTGDGARLVGTVAKQHLVEDHPQRPDVCFHRVALPFEHFGSHVDGRPQHGLGHTLPRLQSFAEAEIPQLDLPISEKDVLGFEISMHDVESVQNFKCLNQLPEDYEGLLLRQLLLLFKFVLQGASVAKLIYKVNVVAGLEVILVFDYIVAQTHGGEDLHFVYDPLLQPWIFLQLGHRDDFDCELSDLSRVDCPIDFSEGALP